MVYHLLVPLAEHVPSFRAFEAITFRALLAGIAAFLICLVVGPGIIDRLRLVRIGEAIRSDSAELESMMGSKAGTPTMGGMIVVLATVIAALLFARLDNTFVQVSLWTLVAMAVLGGIDDRIKLRKIPDPKNPGKTRKGMDAWPKIFGQLLIGGVAMVWLWSVVQHVPGWSEIRVPGFSELAVTIGPLVLAFGVFVLVATSNAVNITDGLDGLAAGCGTIVVIVMALMAYLVGHSEAAAHLGQTFVPGCGELSVFLCALAGGTAGFLWWNCHPAKVFLGNTGSMALGGALAIAAVCMRQELLLIIAGAAFVWDALSVILQVGSYKLRRKRIFRIAPYHHHLQFVGWPESRIVMSFWIGSAFFGVVALGLQRVL